MRVGVSSSNAVISCLGGDEGRTPLQKRVAEKWSRVRPFKNIIFVKEREFIMFEIGCDRLIFLMRPTDMM